MRRNPWSVLLSLVGLVGLVLGSQTVGAQEKPEGKIVRSHRDEHGHGRPAWADEALARSLAHLKDHGQAVGLRNAETELALIGVDEDDLGQAHVRFNQVKDGVPVFGGQLITHPDANTVLEVVGNVFDTTNVDTKPSTNPAQAIKTAKDTLGYQGNFANKPDAQLVVLPNQDGTAGARLSHVVELLVEDGTDNTGRYKYFVDAQTGAVIWFYNDMDTATGSGKSLYSGSVSIITLLSGSTYYLQDDNRGSMLTYTMRNTTSSGYYLTDGDNVWGNYSNSDEDTAGVDAHFGAAKTWDYYYNTYGRRGIDGKGYRMNSRVHYGTKYNNAFWNGSLMTYGDGDGSTFSPLVSLDVVGHEITHGLTEKTAGLVYSGESGAANESFSDIFGTAVEFYTGNVGRTLDYDIGEDIYTPSISGDALRSMSNPGLYGDPDHYSKCYTGTADNGGVHTNSGIPNQAFYLLAAGGTNRTSGISVTGVGRAAAAKIFYRALTVKLWSSANFSNVRAATLSAAADLYGSSSTQYNTTARAWDAVGVK